MSFIAGILTFILVLNCLLLILLVLVQLPKKDAGAGLAFGGGAADALFGAGSGNVLTKVTKWATVVFLAMAVVIGMLQDKLHKTGSAADFEKQVQQKQMQSASSASPAPTPNTIQQPAATTTNGIPALLTTSAMTNAPATAK